MFGTKGVSGLVKGKLHKTARGSANPAPPKHSDTPFFVPQSSTAAMQKSTFFHCEQARLQRTVILKGCTGTELACPAFRRGGTAEAPVENQPIKYVSSLRITPLTAFTPHITTALTTFTSQGSSRPIVAFRTSFNRHAMIIIASA